MSWFSLSLFMVVITINTLQTVRGTNVHNYDFIVVGSGPGGGVVASRLAQTGLYRVLLLEAGPNDIEFNCSSCRLDGGDFIAGSTRLGDGIYLQLGIPDLFWPPWSEPAHIYPKPYPDSFPYDTRVDNLNRAKLLGGCSSHNLMNWNRGNKYDYDYISNTLGINGWSYNDVVPYFTKIEKFVGLNYFNENVNTSGRGLNGTINIRKRPFSNVLKTQELLKTFINYGIPYNNNLNGYIQNGVSEIDTNLGKYNDGEYGIYNSSYYRDGVSEGYIRPTLLNYPNYLILKTKCEALQIIFDDLNKPQPKAIGIKYHDYNTNTIETVYATKEVILSAGVYQTPKLLMVSGVGPKSQLDKFNIPKVLYKEKVGKNFGNHGFFSVVYEVNNTLKQDALTRKSISSIFPGVDDITSISVQAYLSSGTYWRESWNYDDIRIECWEDGWVFQPVTSEVSATLIPPNDGIACFIDPQIYSQNGQVLLRSNNSYDYPAVYPNFLADIRDVDQYIYAIRKFREIMATNPIAFVREVIPGLNYSTYEELRQWIYENIVESSHPVGTVAMGPNEDDAVDNKCKFNGIKNLRIVDSSIWPVTTNAGNQAPTFMIGEKCADHILHDHYRRRLYNNH